MLDLWGCGVVASVPPVAFVLQLFAFHRLSFSFSFVPKEHHNTRKLIFMQVGELALCWRFGLLTAERGHNRAPKCHEAGRWDN